MTLEQWSLVAQIVSAIAVIASLVFVGLQLKHATAAIRAAHADAYSASSVEQAQPIIDSAEFADIWIKGLRDPSKLSEMEWIRFVTFASTMLRLFSSARESWLNGRVDAEQWGTMEAIATDFRHFPGIQKAWKLRGHWFSAGFRAWFEGLTRTEMPRIFDRI